MMQMMQGQGGGGMAASSSVDTLVSVKMGRMTATPIPGTEKYDVKPDKKKGEVKLTRTKSGSPEGEGLIKFIWQDRLTKEEGENMIIFANEASMTRVKTKNDEERVWLLQYKNSERRFFFWGQDLEDKDEAEVEKINLYMNNPAAARKAALGDDADETEPAAVSSDPAATDSSTAAMDTTADTSAAVGNETIGNIMAGLDTSVVAPDVATSAEGEPATPAPVNVDNLQSILSGLGLPASSTPTTTAAATPAAPSKAGGLTLDALQGALSGLAAPASAAVGLTDVVTPGDVLDSSIMSDPAVVARLTALLPPNQRTEEGLRENLRSPQVRQALTSLQSAIAGDSFNEVLANFNLDASGQAASEALQRGDMILAFLEAVKKSVEDSKDAKDE